MYKVAKFVMKFFESNPVFDFNNKLSENIKHKSFIEGSEDFKREKLLSMARNHYFDNENNPFDTYFPSYDFKDLFNGKRILDLGCWCGGKAVSYAKNWGVKEIYGVDINEYFILAANLFANENGDKNVLYNFRLAYAENLPFDDNYFDGIVSYDVLEHVESLELTLREIKRVLKDKAYFFGVFSFILYSRGTSYGFCYKVSDNSLAFSCKSFTESIL